MTPIIMVRFALLLIGIAFFVYSMRSGENWARIAAIVFVAVALLIRFIARMRGPR